MTETRILTEEEALQLLELDLAVCYWKQNSQRNESGYLAIEYGYCTERWEDKDGKITCHVLAKCVVGNEADGVWIGDYPQNVPVYHELMLDLTAEGYWRVINSEHWRWDPEWRHSTARLVPYEPIKKAEGVRA